MRRFILAVGLGSALLLPLTVTAGTPSGMTPEDAAEATRQVEAWVAGEVSYESVSVEVQEAITAFANARAAERTAMLAAIMALLATLFKLLLSGVKLVGGMTFLTQRQKSVIRLTTIGLGIGVYLTSSLVAGMPWWEALFLSLSGPGAMAVHEYSRLFLKKEAGA